MAKDTEWLLQLANDLAKVSKIGRTGVYLFKNYGIKKALHLQGFFYSGYMLMFFMFCCSFCSVWHDCV